MDKKIEVITAVKNKELSVTQAATNLGVSRQTIYDWLEKTSQSDYVTSDLLTRKKRSVWSNSQTIPADYERKIITLIKQYPEASLMQIYTKVNSLIGKKEISYHGFINCLKRNELFEEQDRRQFIQSSDSVPAVFRKRMVEKVISGGYPVAQVASEYGLSRTQVYEWMKRYKERGEEGLVKLIPQVKSGLQSSNEIIQHVLDYVIKSPDLSYDQLYNFFKKEETNLNLGRHGLYNILKQYNLTKQADRLYYASKFAPISTIAPTAPREDTVSLPSLDQLSPQVLPGPPPPASIHGIPSPVSAVVPSIPQSFELQGKPSSRHFLTVLTVSSLVVFLGLSLSFNLVFGLANSHSTSETIGILFGILSLAVGTFFFLYSLKYYLTTAIVLIFSRNLPQIGISSLTDSNKNACLSSNVVDSRRSLSRASTRNGNNRATGLIPDLSSINLERHPFVSIHLPLYNEKRVVNRLLEAVTSMDYVNPSDPTGQAYEVVICDDSTDETSNIVEDWRNHPLVKIIHRDNRLGFKGGALKEALNLTDPRTEFILVFDADFLPYPDTITQFLKYFQVSCATGHPRQASPKLDRGSSEELDSRFHGNDIKKEENNNFSYQSSNIAAIQGYQWHVLNKSENWITRGVRSEYAGSYVIERSGAEVYGGLKQIAGSVFMVRADILRLPQYQWGTSITEDFELTLKLYRDGYKVIYTPYIQAPSECVSTLKRLVRQRMRWAEGHSYNIKKMFSEVLSSSRTTMREKLEFLYLSPYYLQSFFFIFGTFSWFLSEAVFKVRLPFWTQIWGWSLVLTNLLSLPLMNTVGLFLEESEEKDYGGIPSFILLSYILAPFQAYASVKGFLEKQEGPWFRTPKTGKITDVFRRAMFYGWIKDIKNIFGQPSPVVQQISNQFGENNKLNFLYAINSNHNYKNIKIFRRKRGSRFVAILLITVFLLNYLSFFSPQFIKPARAANPTIEQQINIINYTYSASSLTYTPTNNTLGLIHWDANAFSGATVYFEAVIKGSVTSGSPTYYAALYDSAGNAVTNSEVTLFASTTYTRVRSIGITLTDETDYTVRIKSPEDKTTFIRAARLVIVQTSASLISESEAQVEVGNVESTTNTSATRLTDEKIYFYNSTNFSPAPTTYFEADLKSSQPTIEQQINIIDQEYSIVSDTYVPTDNSLGLVRWDANKYTGATVYFEAILKGSSTQGSPAYIAGLHSAAGSLVTNSAVTAFATTTYQWVRSSAITLTDDTDYSVRIKGPGDKTTFIQSARLIIVQTNSTKITDTSTQIELGDDSAGFTNTSLTALTDGKIYQYDQAQFSPTPESAGDIEFHASLKINDTADTVTAELFNNTNSTSVAQVTHTGDTNWTLKIGTNVDGDSDWDTINDDEYLVRVSCTDSNGGGCAGNIANAKLVIIQSSAGGITDVEVVHQQINSLMTIAASTYASQNVYNRLNPDYELPPSFSGGALNYFYEATLKAASTTTAYAQLYNNSSAVAITGSEISTTNTSYSRIRSSDISSNLPTFPTTYSAISLDTQIKNSTTSTTSVSTSWLIIQVSSLATSAVTAYAELYNLTGAAQVTDSQVSTTSTSITRVRSASITLTTAKEYVVRITSSNTGVGIRLYNAKIIFDQSAAGGITALETVQQYNNTLATDADTTYTSQGYPNSFDKANWAAGTFVALFESTLKTSNGSNAYFAQLDTPLGQQTAADTSYTRKTSADLWSSLPATATDIDVQLKNASTSTTSSSNSWLIIDVTSLQVPENAMFLFPLALFIPFFIRFGIKYFDKNHELSDDRYYLKRNKRREG